MEFVRFAHLLGMVMWIGGALAGMVISIGAREEPPEIRAGVFRLLARMHTMIIGVGALIVVTTGVLLSMQLSSSGMGVMMREPRLWVMVLAGLLGGAIVLFVGLPTAVKMGGVAVVSEDGTLLPLFDVYRKRQAMVSSVAGTLAIIALLAWKFL